MNAVVRLVRIYALIQLASIIILMINCYRPAGLGFSIHHI
jgi:hypothetical protein